jgi:hypothetical protein
MRWAERVIPVGADGFLLLGLTGAGKTGYAATSHV